MVVSRINGTTELFAGSRILKEHINFSSTKNLNKLELPVIIALQVRIFL